MYNYDYDESGLLSSYLLLTVAAPVLVYQLYALTRSKRKFPCGCKECKSKGASVSKKRMLFIALLAGATAVLVRNILNIKLAGKALEFNPMELLDVTENDSAAKIKKSYKKKLRQAQRVHKTNTKNGVENSQALYNTALMNLNKAYEIMKNEESYLSWLASGIERKLVIAIPSFFINFSGTSILLYLAIFCVAVPLLAFLKYRFIKNRCYIGSLFKTNERFFEAMDSFPAEQSIMIQSLLLFISKTDEIKNRNYKNDISDKKGTIEKMHGEPLLSDANGYMHVMDFLHRTGFGHKADQTAIKQELLYMIDSFMKISLTNDKTKLYEGLLLLRKMVVQAVYNPKYSILQYPGIDAERILQEEYKCSAVVEDMSNKNTAKSGKIDEEVLQRITSTEECKKFKAHLPKPVLEDLEIYAYDTNEDDGLEENYTKVVDSSVDSKTGLIFKVGKNVVPVLSFNLKIKGGSYENCHSPYGDVDVKHKFTVYYRIGNKLINDVVEVDKEQNLSFNLPSSRQKEDLIRIFVVSNGYFGTDAFEQVTLRYI
ncbi:translocation protein SEC63 [Enteropsectra breve]|nr:translocation protein SEC63 [Enteropsectra breve]